MFRTCNSMREACWHVRIEHFVKFCQIIIMRGNGSSPRTGVCGREEAGGLVFPLALTVRPREQIARCRYGSSALLRLPRTVGAGTRRVSADGDREGGARQGWR